MDVSALGPTETLCACSALRRCFSRGAATLRASRLPTSHRPVDVASGSHKLLVWKARTGVVVAHSLPTVHGLLFRRAASYSLHSNLRNRALPRLLIIRCTHLAFQHSSAALGAGCSSESRQP